MKCASILAVLAALSVPMFAFADPPPAMEGLRVFCPKEERGKACHIYGLEKRGAFDPASKRLAKAGAASSEWKYEERGLDSMLNYMRPGEACFGKWVRKAPQPEKAKTPQPPTTTSPTKPEEKKTKLPVVVTAMVPADRQAEYDALREAVASDMAELYTGRLERLTIRHTPLNDKPGWFSNWTVTECTNGKATEHGGTYANLLEGVQVYRMKIQQDVGYFCPAMPKPEPPPTATMKAAIISALGYIGAQATYTTCRQATAGVSDAKKAVDNFVRCLEEQRTKALGTLQSQGFAYEDLFDK